MRIAKWKTIQWLYWLVLCLYVIGIYGVIWAKSFVGAFSLTVLWMAANRLIRRTWIDARAGEYVIHNGVPIKRVMDACFIRRKDIPKGSIIAPINGKASIQGEWFVPSIAHNGFIISLTVKIGCEEGASLEEAGLCYRYFKNDPRKKEDYLFTLLQEFQGEQCTVTGVFGHIYGLLIGTDKWSEHVLQSELTLFLGSRLKQTGLHITTLSIVPRERGRSILRKGKE